MAKKKKKRADGRYKSSFMYEGKRYYVYGSTRDELEANKARKRQALKDDILDRQNPTLNNYYDQYEEINRHKVKEATIRSQRTWFKACATVQITKSGLKLGEMRIRDIKPKDCQTVQKALIDSGKASRTVNNYMDLLSHVFNVAVYDETIDRNPCRCIQPIRRTEPPARETKHRALSQEETEDFLAGATNSNSFYLNHFIMMLLTGIRVGELGALTENDIDRKKNCLHINKTVTRTDVGGYAIGDSTKTYAGMRDIPLNQSIIDVVDRQKTINHALFGLRFGQQLFPSTDGVLLREYPINREIKRITTRSGIDHFTCHAFRATFATRFIEQRPQDYKILAEILGHSNTKITLDLYTHVMQEAKEKAMQSIEIPV